MNKKTSLILITSIAFLIRFYQPTKTPLLWDEAAIGYNAFSILKTGRDEYGTLLPLIFKSFGDYKPGFYIYLTVPFVFLFGLNTISVRLPSVILGSLAPLFLYLLITKINPKKTKLATISALLLAVTPFHIHFSRGAWETNILTSQLLLSLYFFQSFVKSKTSKYLFISSIIFALSLYTYQSAKLVSLAFIFFLFISNFKLVLSQHKKIISHFIFPMFLIVLPICWRLVNTSDTNRLQVLSMFSYPRSEQQKQQIIDFSGSVSYAIFNNDFIYLTRQIFSKYFNHFSSKFLFFSGDWQNPRHSAIYTGVLPLASLIFFPLSLILIKAKSKQDKFFLFWLLIAPLASALTRDTVSAVRSASLVIPITYFTARGIISFSKLFKKYQPVFHACLFFAYFLSFIYYAELYLNHTVNVHPSDHLYGYKQAIDYVSQHQSKYDQVVFTDFYGQPYIFYLFFTKYPPSKYQSTAHLAQKNLDTGTVNQIDNIRFVGPNTSYCLNHPNTLCLFSNQEKIRSGIYFNKFDNNIDRLGTVNNQTQFYAYPKN